jgi:hypothetical protein
MDLYDFLIPMVLIIVPSLLLYNITTNKAGFLGGAVLGIIICYSAGLVGAWALIIAIMSLASIFVGHEGGKE